ncbi:unnamed protein product [Rhizophagus irregularis]|uniref:Uncharacterized protein n=1 Tax=Rhizophagus irregularis TaxID=588596 RepID=A0A916EFH1_9GLOM|nr:unnamed protein product [Rhizophagus irregularis]CAB5383683.1 unnamed protein product [Rhizophagus irregularis]
MNQDSFRHSILERWIYGFRLSVGLWIYGFWFMDFGYMGFDFRLGFGYMGSTFGWALDIWISFSSRAFGYIDFDFRFLGFR